MKKFILAIALLFPVSLSAQATVDTVDVPALDTILTGEGVTTSARTVTSAGVNTEVTVTWNWKSDTAKFSPLRTRGSSSDTVRFFAQSDTGRAYLRAFAGAKKDSTLYIIRHRCSLGVDGVNVLADSLRLSHPSMTFLGARTYSNCGATPVDSAVTWTSRDAAVATVQTTGRLNTVATSTDTTYVVGSRGTGSDSVRVIVIP